MLSVRHPDLFEVKSNNVRYKVIIEYTFWHFTRLMIVFKKKQAYNNVLTKTFVPPL